MRTSAPITFAFTVTALLLMVSCRTHTPEHAVNSRERWLKEHAGSIHTPQLVKETRWSLTYRDPETGHYLDLSKFMTEEATITERELEANWPGWSLSERSDFCGSVSQGAPTNSRQILHFVMANGDLQHWSQLALRIAQYLPASESAPFLSNCLREAAMGKGANFSQAMAGYRLPGAVTLITARLDKLWNHPDILAVPDRGSNPIAFEATCCVQHLRWLGASKEELAERARLLMSHPNALNAETARNYLSEFREAQPSAGRDGKPAPQP